MELKLVINTSIMMIVPIIYIKLYKKTLEQLFNMTYGLYFLINWINIYINKYNDNELFMIKRDETIEEFLLINSICYVIFTIESIYENDYEMIYHHLLSLMMMTLANNYLYHQLSLITLLIFSISKSLFSS